MKHIFRTLEELCDHRIEKRDPALNPEAEFWYVDISSVDNVSKAITNPTLTKGKSASVRAQQVIKTGDVLVSTTRPNLNAVALVPEKFDGEICSTGFCVLRCGAELDSEYLFFLVRSKRFVDSLSDLVKGALYPAVTGKQVYAQKIPWHPIADQCRIAARLKAQLAEVEKARQAAEMQLAEINLLPQKILTAAFSMSDGEEIV